MYKCKVTYLHRRSFHLTMDCIYDGDQKHNKEVLNEAIKSPIACAASVCLHNLWHAYVNTGKKNGLHIAPEVKAQH